MIGLGSAARRAAAAALALALIGCASLPSGAGAPGGQRFNGRLSLNIAPEGSSPARAVTAAFELQGSADDGRLDLSTPLGSLMARARWSPARVVLQTPRGESEFTGLDALTREALGESLPVAALFDWLQGRPWPGAPSLLTAQAGPGFEQLGWEVDLARYADDAIVSARRASPPPVTVRIKLERP